MKTARLEYVDYAKGVMILLVVVGHICQYYFGRGKYEPMYGFIYSFHMPLFFLLSGYVVGVTQKRIQSQTFRKWLGHKVQTLLVPFAVWGLFIYRFIDPVGSAPLDIEALRLLVVSPDNNGAWFLISLFCIQVVCYPVFRYDKPWAWAVPIMFVVAGTVLGGSFFYCNPYHYASFLAGYLFFKYKDWILRDDVATTALLLFVTAEILHPNPLPCTLTAGVALLYMCYRASLNGGGVILGSLVSCPVSGRTPWPSICFISFW
mgnify:CR=1 FL=1